jgi:hypothetical protein
MRSKRAAGNPKTFVIILDTGDKFLSSLKSVATPQKQDLQKQIDPNSGIAHSNLAKRALQSIS